MYVIISHLPAKPMLSLLLALPFCLSLHRTPEPEKSWP